MKPRSSYIYYMHFSPARLRGHRDGLGLTQEQLARRVALHRLDYHLIEDGVLAPSKALAAALAHALDLPAHELDRTGTYEEDYAAAVLQHVEPMTAEDIAQAADAIYVHEIRIPRVAS